MLLVIQEIEKEQQPTDIALNFSPFLVRLYNLPFGYRSDEKVKTIAKAIGDFLELKEDFLDINPFRRVRVMMDITKPLKCSQMIRLKNHTTLKIDLKYERLPYFCFLCGLLCHTEKDCNFVSEEEKEGAYGWGMHLKASPSKGISKNNEEILALKSRKCLFVPKPKENAESIASEATKSPYIEAHGDKEEDTGAHSNLEALGNTSTTPLSFSDNLENVDVVVNGGAPIINYDAAVAKDGGISCPTLNDTTAYIDAVGSIPEIPFCPSFEIGCSNPPTKKLLKPKKKKNGESIKICRDLNRKGSWVDSQDPSDSCKRKIWDMDVVMEDSEMVMKRSCMVQDMDGSLNDIVAEVGDHQPRKQQ